MQARTLQLTACERAQLTRRALVLFDSGIHGGCRVNEDDKPHKVVL